MNRWKPFSGYATRYLIRVILISQVSMPQYARLMALQDKVVKLDGMMRKIQETAKDPESLAMNPKWQMLVELRQSLDKMLPN